MCRRPAERQREKWRLPLARQARTRPTYQYAGADTCSLPCQAEQMQAFQVRTIRNHKAIIKMIAAKPHSASTDHLVGPSRTRAFLSQCGQDAIARATRCRQTRQYRTVRGDCISAPLLVGWRTRLGHDGMLPACGNACADTANFGDGRSDARRISFSSLWSERLPAFVKRIGRFAIIGTGCFRNAGILPEASSPREGQPPFSTVW